ncbi:uncharacterized protein LOC141601387 [Silene latifolia]|uniref:uncharacterized protein LOC141601387 n=1 Tax=Silene latifolia TaxID=37657 RepID=UPI003D782220
MFKIDLQKAYDTVEWSFVEQLLDELLFPDDFKAMVLQCISTASFSLSLNGDMFGYFQDDVLLFSRGNAHSMMLLLKSFSTFSNASGLKICSRIHNYGAKKFFYAGRLVLVKAVLSSLHSYWALIFIIPKGIISRIEATCRNFPWDSSTDYMRVPMVAWEKICRPKEEGGLGLKDQGIMNKAMIGRLVHWITVKKDSIWVKWVQKNYLKGRDWLDYTPSTSSSWVWRRICKVKEEMLPGYTTGKWNAKSEYSPSDCYEWLKGTNLKVTWYNCLWNDHVIPKHQFIGWLVAHGALRTRDKLISRRVI